MARVEDQSKQQRAMARRQRCKMASVGSIKPSVESRVEHRSKQWPDSKDVSSERRVESRSQRSKHAMARKYMDIRFIGTLVQGYIDMVSQLVAGIESRVEDRSKRWQDGKDARWQV